MEPDQVQATDPTTVTEDVQVTPTVDTAPEAETKEVDVAALQAQIDALQGKLTKSVQAEKNLRANNQTAAERLAAFEAAEATREAERVASLTLTQKLEEAEAARVKAETEAQAVKVQWGDFKVQAELEQAGFLAGFEGDAKTAQLTTLKALTGLELVRENGEFSIDKFAERFSSMKPTIKVENIATPFVETKVVDLGGNGTPPAQGDAERFQQLLKARETAWNRGQRLEVIGIDRELAALQAKK